MMIFLVTAAAFLLDMLLGDPVGVPHIVVGIGKTISGAKRVLRGVFPNGRGGELFAGFLLAFFVPFLWAAAVWALIRVLNGIYPPLGIATQIFICWQCLAARSLEKAASAVKTALGVGIESARRAVSMIVGRDTAALDEAGVARAAVETVAENTCDGVIAPLFYMALGGVPLTVFYKAVNTLDSMVGYKNEEYIWFGRASARLDDVMNFIPARLSALLLLLSVAINGGDAGGALRIFLRDRYNHKSPNSAQSESVCAGALGVRLGGGNFYFGQWVEKPYIGDDTRKIEPADIDRTNKMMLTAGWLGLAAVLIIRGAAVLCAVMIMVF